jgi:hypothetical protein
MADERTPPQPVVDRADVIRRQSASPGAVNLYGSAATEIQRVIQALGALPDISGVTVQLGLQALPGVPLLDATRAPFRVNGRRWSLGYNLPATAASNNIVDVQNRADVQPPNGLAIVTVEEVRYQGPSVCAVACYYSAQNVTGGAGNGRDLEKPTSATINASTKNFFQGITSEGITNNGDTFAAVAANFAFLVNVAAGSPPDVWQPDGIVLWPGEIIHLFQITQNVAMTVTLSGKYWTFAPTLASVS